MNNSSANIRDFIHVLSNMPRTDMLVNLPETDASLVSLDELPKDKLRVVADGKWKALWQTANKFRLEADVNSLCLVFGTVSSATENGFLRSPLLLVPLHWDYTRITNTLQLELHEELVELNPYVRFLFAELTNAAISDFPDELNLQEKLEWITGQFRDMDLENTVSPDMYIGNFHYHRFHLLRELEGIERAQEKSPLVEQLLGNDFDPPAKLDLSPGLIYPADADQKQVFDVLAAENVLLQGPPGTGKSQVLINILGKSLKGDLKVLVVSEKRAALDVLVKKLSELQLDPFAFVVHSQTKSKDLLTHLKATWNWMESADFRPVKNLRLSEQHHANLQLLLDRLNTPGYFAGISYGEFQDLLRETPISKETFSSAVPGLDEWLENKAVIQKIDRHLGGFSRLRGLKRAFFEQWNGDQLVKNELLLLNSLQTGLDELRTFGDLENMIAVLGRCQLIENENYKAYSQLIARPREWKKFRKQVQLFRELQAQLQILETENRIWKETPSKSQVESWEQANTWLQLRKRKKAITKLLHDSSVLPEIALSNWKNYLAEKKKLRELETYLNELGLDANIHALELGMHYASGLEKESGSLLSEIASWSREKRLRIIESGSQLNALRSNLQRYFELNDEVVLADFLLQKQAEFANLAAVYEDLKNSPRFFFSLVAETDSWQEMQELILFSSLKKIESVNPELVKFSGESLYKRLEHVIETEDHEFAEFADLLRFEIQKRFYAFEEILRTPGQKLSVSQKEFKTKLKKGKSLLVKEFGKSRNNLPIRKLLASDAKPWIQLLIPVWLATPNQVADHFPLETELFDLALFDEASQLPLPNALGSLFRSKRALVAGDEQQMAPSAYFGKNFGFHDLLHQAAYYFQRVALKHHYRSEHRELIAFSNAHFYGNELIVYPAAQQRKVLFQHYSEDGVFDERKNQVEAAALAAFLENFGDWEQKTVGIVAFSEEQLKAVWKACSPRVQEWITIRQEENSLFFKALENVQGDEADLLLVSLGYAKNPEGTFQLRFGPLNQSNGHKRLNVLVTRAKQEMHFFTSVYSTHFDLSDNESVNMLRRFLHDLENYQLSGETLVFPHALEAERIEGDRVYFRNSYVHIPNGQDLVTFHRVMKQRGWKLSY